MKKLKKCWDKPLPVDEVTFAFPSRIIGSLLPPVEDIPREFFDHYNDWCRLVTCLMFKGGSLPKVKPGIDAGLAHRHLTAVLRSYEPKHEHKEAGAAWLMSLWCEDGFMPSYPAYP